MLSFMVARVLFSSSCSREILIDCLLGTGPETASPTLLYLFQWPRFVLIDVRKNTSGEKGPFWSYFTFGIASIQLQALTFSILLLFSCSVVSNSLRPHGLQHARLPSSTVSWSLFKLMFIESEMPSNHLILCRPLLLLPASGSFQMSQLFVSGGQSTGASASASVLPKNTQD